MPVVYIDLLFLINFLMDSATLYCTSLFIKRPASLLRITLAAAILAAYSSVMFFPNICFVYSFWGKTVILTVSVRVAFPSKNWKCLIKNTILFFTVNAIFGGIMFALIFFTDFGTKVGAAVSNGEIYLNIRASTVILAAIPAYSAAVVISSIRRQNIKQDRHLAELEIQFNKNSLKLCAFADTGCNLRSPITKKSAVIISRSAAKRLLPSDLFAALFLTTAVIPEKYSSRIIFLPYSTIDKNHGMLYGFIPDRLAINGTEKKSCIVAVSKRELCNNSQFDAIFNPDILDEEITYNINTAERI